MFSRPVRSSWKPVPTSSSEPIAAVDVDEAGGRLGDPREHLQQRPLAGAVAADDADHFARGHLERHVVQRPQRVRVRLRLGGAESQRADETRGNAGHRVARGA